MSMGSFAEWRRAVRPGSDSNQHVMRVMVTGRSVLFLNTAWI